MGTNNGWLDKVTFFLLVMQVFQPTTKCSPDNLFLLFTDGHTTWYTTDTIVLAKQLGCHIVVIPPHATHFIGVTNNTCHGPYHVRYSKCTKVHLKDDIYIPWADYVGMATRSLYESFTPLNIINGFRTTGLWPINAAEPLEAMKNVEPSEKKKQSQREIRSMKKKLDLALFALP